MLGSMGNSSMDNFRESLTTFSDHLLSVSHFGYGYQPSHASGSRMSMLYMLAWLGTCISVQWILSSHLMNTFVEAHRFDVWLFVFWGGFVPLDNFSLIWKRHRATNFDLFSWPLSIEGSLKHHAYCDTGQSFTMVISVEDPWHSHLLQWGKYWRKSVIHVYI